MHLAAADHDAIAKPLFYTYVGIGVWLVGRPQYPVALNVRLSAAAHQVLCLEAYEPLLEVLVVLGGTVVHLVRFVGYVVDGVGGVNAHAPLDAAAHLLTEHTGHVLLLVQVVGVLMDVGKAANPLTGEMRYGGAQLLVLWLGCFIERDADGIDAVHLALICSVDNLAVEVDVSPHLSQSLDVLLFCPHFSSLLNW